MQGDVCKVVNAIGTVVASYTYDAWGKILSAEGSMAEINPIRYRGYYYDEETGFYYLQSRYYDPEIGRFINADDPELLIEDSESLLQYNLYAFCWNNPVNYSDFNGETPIQAIFAAMGTIAGWYLGDYIAKKLGYTSGWKYWAIRTGAVGGGGALGWFAGGALTAVLKGFIFSSPKLMASTPLWIYKALGIVTGSGAVVLGRYPTYLALAEKLGAQVFSIAKVVWNTMSSTAQWAANQAFLDKTIQAGQKFTLSANAYKAVPGTSFYKEIQYLLAHGYKIVEYGWGMIKK